MKAIGIVFSLKLRVSSEEVVVDTGLIAAVASAFGVNWFLPGCILIAYAVCCQRRGGHWAKDSFQERYPTWIKVMWVVSPFLLILITVFLAICCRDEFADYKLSTTKDWVNQIKKEKARDEKRRQAIQQGIDKDGQDRTSRLGSSTTNRLGSTTNRSIGTKTIGKKGEKNGT